MIASPPQHTAHSIHAKIHAFVPWGTRSLVSRDRLGRKRMEIDELDPSIDAATVWLNLGREEPNSSQLSCSIPESELCLAKKSLDRRWLPCGQYSTTRDVRGVVLFSFSIPKTWEERCCIRQVGCHCGPLGAALLIGSAS
jgi:hypothetical protein